MGNVVALLPGDDLRNLVQENAYDPWGLNLPDLERSAVLPDWWQFSMKERDFRAYDEFEFRHYDASIGRFMSIDPLFQQFRGISPFNYADNNPSTFIDLYGLQGVNPNTCFQVDWIAFVRDLEAVVVTAKRAAPVYKELIGQAAGNFFIGTMQAGVRGIEAVTHPQQMVEGMARLSTSQGQVEAITGMTMLYDNVTSAWKSGDVGTRANIVGNVFGEVAFGWALGKGLGNLNKVRWASTAFKGELYTAGFGGRAAKGVNGIISKSLRIQKQVDEHIIGGSRLGTNSYLNSVDDATSVLNAAHSGEAKILSTNVGQNRAYVQYNNVTGYYNNNGVIIPTNKFLIKGGKSSTVVPIHPNSTTFK